MAREEERVARVRTFQSRTLHKGHSSHWFTLKSPLRRPRDILGREVGPPWTRPRWSVTALRRARAPVAGCLVARNHNGAGACMRTTRPPLDARTSVGHGGYRSFRPHSCGLIIWRETKGKTCTDPTPPRHLTDTRARRMRPLRHTSALLKFDPSDRPTDRPTDRPAVDGRGTERQSKSNGR